ncbi:hypothetical protein GCM10028805_47140 [Spirosoma harenae]
MEKKRKQAVTASDDWKGRMLAAKSELTGLSIKVGQQEVILKVIELNPSLDSLAFANRWRRAWFVNNSDPEITQAVEAAVSFFKEKAKRNRIRRQNMAMPR